MSDQFSKTGKLLGVLVALVLVLAGLRLSGVFGPWVASYDATLTGKVSIDGVHADRGMVSFFPADGSLVFIGKIESDGTYKVVPGRAQSVESEQGGIDSGEYSVAVNIGAALTEDDLIDTNAPRRQVKSLIASEYSSKATSGLKFTVKPGPNTYNIELEGPGEETVKEEESSAVETVSDETTPAESLPPETDSDEANEIKSDKAESEDATFDSRGNTGA